MRIEALLDEWVCRKHGAYAHIALHEAAHAVFATIFGFAFSHVTVATPAELLAGIVASGQDGTVAGGVHLVGSPSTWVPSSMTAEAMDFCMAGRHAEMHELGDRNHRGVGG